MTFAQFRSLHAKMAAALLAVAALAGCGPAQSPTLNISVIDSDTSIFNTERSRLSSGAQLVRGATAQGLVSLNEAGELVPALAARWIVTDDGQSYIFRLKSAEWRSGQPVTAVQVAKALRERIRMARPGRLGRELTEIRDIRTMTGEVVEIRLNAPNPNLLQVLAQPELGISRNADGSGPLNKANEGSRIDFEIRPEDEEEDGEADEAEDIPAITLRAESAAEAIARYDMGYADMVLNGRFQDLMLIDIADISPNNLKLDPVSGLFGLQFVEQDGILSTAIMREAISMAIDRERLRTALNIESDENSNRIVPPFIEDFDAIAEEPWLGRAMSSRRFAANSRISSWKTANGEPRVLRIALPDGPGSDLLFASISSDLRIVGLQTRRVPLNANADLRLVDEVAVYNSPAWYLNQIACVRRRVCDEAGDELIKQAKAASNPDEREALLAQAERSMSDYHSFIVLGQPIRWSLVRGDPPGFATNPFAYHPLPPLATITR